MATPWIIPITEQPAWDKELSASGMLVADVHSSWCGRAKAAEATIKRLFFEYMDKDTGPGVRFAAVDADKVESMKERSGTSRPVFLIYHNGVLIDEISGVNTPLLCSHVEHLFKFPPPPPQQQKSISRSASKKSLSKSTSRVSVRSTQQQQQQQQEPVESKTPEPGMSRHASKMSVVSSVSTRSNVSTIAAGPAAGEGEAVAAAESQPSSVVPTPRSDTGSISTKSISDTASVSSKTTTGSGNGAKVVRTRVSTTKLVKSPTAATSSSSSVTSPKSSSTTTSNTTPLSTARSRTSVRSVRSVTAKPRESSTQ